MINGETFIGARAVQGSVGGVRAVDPQIGDALEPTYLGATREELDEACRLAAAAFDPYRNAEPEQRARLLEAIADNILGLGDELVQRCVAESGLTKARIENERGRTVNQLRLFGRVIRSGRYLEARINHAQPDRTPAPPNRMCGRG